ncbi:rhomboid family intramembrane serine protease [Neolewinella antarctica]|uniref:Membrane associated rhomboid family serine protease n=1 Tax=Neolewinella antarctica TaxID=442734 RepID=A0ABX0XG19_9BACT|nr:rhomboid family intramembrane serine protease [Neolewinella antarctica]NJC28167.1 membrane associated rhomboid family serine protease [Neolewinella antarctica]
MVKTRSLVNIAKWPVLMLAVMWLVFGVDMLLGGQLTYQYGLSSREIAGLPGIVMSPFLHGGIGHILSNSFPFLTLSGLLVFFYPRLWPRVLATLWLGTGALVWTLGRDVTHIGASGVVYALAAFLAFSGIFRRDFRAVIVSLIVLFYYGGMVSGVLPGQEGISWESHLLGLVMGGFSGWLFRGELEAHEVAKREKDAARRKPRNKEHFLAADAFTKTKAERAAEAKQQAIEADRLALDDRETAFWRRMERIKEEDKLRR